MSEQPSGLRASFRRGVKGKAARFLLLGLTVAAAFVVASGLCTTFERTYASWSGNRLSALVAGGGTVSSSFAPVAWPGVGPLCVDGLELNRGDRVEFKLRTTAGRAPVRVLIDGRPQARFQVGPGWRTYRLWLERDATSLRLDQTGAAPAPVHIARVKVTNVAGFAEGLVNLWVVRRGVECSRVPLAVAGTVFVSGVTAAVFLLLSLGRRSRFTGTLLQRSAGGVGAALFVLGTVRLTAVAAGFDLILTPGTAVLLLLASAVGAGAWPLGRRLHLERMWRLLTTRPVAAPAVIGVTAVVWTLALLVLVLGRFGGDLRGVARFGSRFERPPALAGVPELSRFGYDGQFYAVLASDPLLCNPATVRGLDNPGYRATRVLVPFLAWASVGGSARLGPVAYVVWCWALGLAGPGVVLLWPGRGRSAPWWIVVLWLNSGLVVSVLRATPDAAALTLMLVALALAEREDRPASVCAGGVAAVLARETSVLAIPGIAWREAVARRWRRAAVLVLAPAAALAGWRLYVGWATRAGAGSEWTNFGLPFLWLPGKGRQLAAAGWDHGKVEWLGVAWVLLLTAAAASYLVWRRRPSALIPFVLFGALALALNLRVYEEAYAYARVLIALPLLAAVLVAGEELAWRRMVLIAGIVLASLQGALLLRSETSHSWDALHRGREVTAAKAWSGDRPGVGPRRAKLHSGGSSCCSVS